MESLLRLMLVHYYQDSRRATKATITRALDRRIRELVVNDKGLQQLVLQCRRDAEAFKRKARTSKSKSRKSWHHHGNPGVQHIPCRDRRG